MTYRPRTVLNVLRFRLQRTALRGVRFVEALILRGGEKECPVCGWRFRAMLPGGKDGAIVSRLHLVGGGRRRNVYCPRCLSSDRQRHLYLYLKLRTSLFTGPPCVLHVAPAKALKRLLLRQPALRYVTADLRAPDVMVRMDISRIPCADASFDAILCSHVLEHVPDDRRALAELYRVLKPGGWALLQAPIAPALKTTYEDPSIKTAEGRLAAFGHGTHLRIYGVDYRSRLEQAGFSVELFRYGALFGEEAAARHALIEDEDLYVCRK